MPKKIIIENNDDISENEQSSDSDTLTKSKHKAGDALDDGEYNFYTSSRVIKKSNFNDYKNELKLEIIVGQCSKTSISGKVNITKTKLDRIKKSFQNKTDEEIVNERCVTSLTQDRVKETIASIDKIEMNIETGKIKLCKTDLNTFSSLVNKYGVEKVGRANKVADLYQEQQKDSSKDEEFKNAQRTASKEWRT